MWYGFNRTQEIEIFLYGDLLWVAFVYYIYTWNSNIVFNISIQKIEVNIIKDIKLKFCFFSD